MEVTDAVQLYNAPLSELTSRADSARRSGVGDELELCGIINAKSGRCPEDCAFCAQSYRHSTGAEEYPLVEEDDIVEAARRAKENGSLRFGIVTSGRGPSEDEVDRVARAAERIRDDVDMGVCASLGHLSSEQFRTLRDAGITRYNHNVETSPSHFEQIVSTHSFDDRVETVERAADSDLSVCCGGILGLGETREQRVHMAFELKKLPVDSVPINVLMSVPGTGMEEAEPPSAVEVLKTIAIFRLIMPDRTIKLAAGREKVLADFQGMAFMGGANGMIVGDYLTQRGRSAEEDRRLVKEVRKAWKN